MSAVKGAGRAQATVQRLKRVVTGHARMGIRPAQEQIVPLAVLVGVRVQQPMFPALQIKATVALKIFTQRVVV